MIVIARRIAAEYELDPALVCAVCHHESEDWNTLAMRFEPAFLDRWVPKELRPTERYARAYSYGLMQIMGQTAREFGFKGKYLSELYYPEIGIEFGCKKLKHSMDRANGDVHQGLLSYNGGSNAEYPSLVLAHYDEYKQSPTAA